MNAAKLSLVVFGLFLGLIVSALFGSGKSVAAEGAPPANHTMRYQVSAYAAQNAGGFVQGCYVVDTVTGQLWHARQGGQSEKVGVPLAQ